MAVTGCSRISLENANLVGIMLIDMEKKQLRTAPLGGEPRADDIESVAVTDKSILLHGTGKRESDRTWSAVISLETGNVNAGVSTIDSSLSLLGKCTAQPCWVWTNMFAISRFFSARDNHDLELSQRLLRLNYAGFKS